MAELSVTCLVPAYNEAGRIGGVLATLRACPEVAEILVIDDGSADATVAEARAALEGEPRARVLVQPENGGKSRAIARGIEEARGTHLMFLDADLQGLDPAALKALIEPVAAGQADVSISLRHNAPGIWRMIGLDYISGERVLPAAPLKDRADEIAALPGFGLEVYLNRLWLDEEARIGVVRWPNVDSPYKSEKVGVVKGLVADAKMLSEMFQAVSMPEALHQIVAMRAKRVMPA